jgi:hypothetical protein
VAHPIAASDARKNAAGTVARQLVRNAGLGFLEAMLPEPFGKFLVGDIGALQFGLHVPCCAFGPFLFGLGEIHRASEG